MVRPGYFLSFGRNILLRPHDLGGLQIGDVKPGRSSSGRDIDTLPIFT